jgi:hypothetical protein
METPEHQEKRSRQRVSWSAIIKTAVVTGLILFIMSGGGPWSTAGTMNVIMGRDVKLPFAGLALGHFTVALLYIAVIAHVIYRFRVVMGIVAGLGVTLALYAVNFAIFRMSGMEQQSPEFRTFLVHVTFGIMASAIYKALSVPKPLRGAAEQVAV